MYVYNIWIQFTASSSSSSVYFIEHICHASNVRLKIHNYHVHRIQQHVLPSIPTFRDLCRPKELACWDTAAKRMPASDIKSPLSTPGDSGKA